MQKTFNDKPQVKGVEFVLEAFGTADQEGQEAWVEDDGTQINYFTPREAYDVVLVDSPPILQATDAAILGTKVDGVLLIYKIGNVSRSALRRAKGQLDNLNVSVMGIVINGLRAEVSEDFKDLRYYSYYSYGSQSDTATGPLLCRSTKVPYYGHCASTKDCVSPYKCSYKGGYYICQ